jgi:hypothetical protein
MAKPPKDAKAAGRPAIPGQAGRRGGGARPIGALLPDVGGVAFRRFGFVQGALLARWRDVVGPVYARWSVPQSIRFARGEKTGGTLTIRVEGPFITQLQHVAPQILERVNRILGYEAVARLRLVQGEVPAPAERPVMAGVQGPAPVTNLAGVGDATLRAALEGLAAQLSADGGDAPTGEALVVKGPPKIG